MTAEDHSDEFERELSALKDAGSSILLAGTIPQPEFYDVSVSLLGEAGGTLRRRILVGPEDGIDAQVDRLPEEPAVLDRNHIQAIQLDEETRSTAATAAGASVEIPTEEIPAADPETLSKTVEEHITRFEHEAGSFEPAELRVSIDGMTGILDAHGEEILFRLIHILNAIVTRRSGMIHYVLPLDRNRVTVRTLETLFDVVVELRMRSGEVEQRWELLDAGLTSEWVPLDTCRDAKQDGLGSGSEGGDP